MTSLLAQATQVEDQLGLDSQILAEQFYFFTVVIMWLIHVGFMSYEAGAARRKNIMSTAMKNILTIAVVTPTFYYFGWGFYGFYAACLVIQSTVFPGWLNIYLSPTTLGAIAMVITVGFAGGFTGGWFASKGDPFWTLSGGLAGVISVSAGADVYHPSLAYLLSISGGMLAVWSGTWIERKLRVDDAVGAVAVHGVCGFYGVLLVGVFAGGYPTGVNNIESSMGGQLMGILTFLPLAFLPGYVFSWILKKLNLLRVPA